MNNTPFIQAFNASLKINEEISNEQQRLKALDIVQVWYLLQTEEKPSKRKKLVKQYQNKKHYYKNKYLGGLKNE